MIPLKLVGFVVCSAVIFMYFYTPVPDGAADEDKWMIRKFFAMSQIGKIVARVGSTFGYDSAINITRAFTNKLIVITPDEFKDVVSTDHIFDGVNVTIHQKAHKKGALRPALVYIHGGGWVYEYRELFGVLERLIVEKADHVVISIDYPLAPENPYPTPLQHCVKAIKYIHKNAEKLGIDADLISVGGDSAGGNLAAATALKLRDDGDSILRSQILISPAVQLASFRLQSYLENDIGSLKRKDMINYWLYYTHEDLKFYNELESNEHISPVILKGKVWPYLQKYQKFPQSHVKIDEKVIKRWEKIILDPYICPLFAKTLAGLPKTLLMVSEFDVLRDEALAYNDRLKEEGVDVTMDKTKGFHGVYLFGKDSKVGAGMANKVISFLRSLQAKQKADDDI